MVFYWRPDPGPPANSESHLAMIGAVCPVLPLETDARSLVKPFFVNGFVPFRLAARFFICAVIVIVGSVTRARVAAKNRAAYNVARPTAAISKVSKTASIIRIVRKPTDCAVKAA